VTVDQYSTFTINAQGSYDSEDNTQTNLTYLWECPSQNGFVPAACSQNDPLLTITYADRVAMEANSADQQYQYSLKI
jgi:hypothetical protein